MAQRACPELVLSCRAASVTWTPRAPAELCRQSERALPSIFCRCRDSVFEGGFYSSREAEIDHLCRVLEPEATAWLQLPGGCPQLVSPRPGPCPAAGPRQRASLLSSWRI